jgi:hypothetical protein
MVRFKHNTNDMDKENIYLNRIKNAKRMAADNEKELKILFSVMVQTGSKATHQHKINKCLNQPLDYQNQITINRYGLILKSKTELIEYIHSPKIDISLIVRKQYKENI